MSGSCRNRSLRKWWHCTFLHSVRWSASLPRFADEAFEGFFSHFSPISKKCGLRPPVRRTRWVDISTLSAHQMAPGGVVAHSSSWKRAAYELEECASSSEASHEVLFQNFLMVGGKETRLCTF